MCSCIECIGDQPEPPEILTKVYVRLTPSKCSWYEPVPQSIGTDIVLLVNENHQIIGVGLSS